MRTTKVLAVGMLDERKKENSIVYPDVSSTLANTVHIISQLLFKLLTSFNWSPIKIPRYDDIGVGFKMILHLQLHQILEFEPMAVPEQCLISPRLLRNLLWNPVQFYRHCCTAEESPFRQEAIQSGSHHQAARWVRGPEARGQQAPLELGSQPGWQGLIAAASLNSTR